MLILAEAAAIDTATAMNVGLLVLGLITLFTLIEKGLSIYRMTRPVPPYSEVIAKCATKEDLSALACRLGETRAETNNAIDKLEKRLDAEMHSVRSYNAKNTREIYDALNVLRQSIEGNIARLSGSMNEEFKDLNAVIGEVRGELKRINPEKS